MKPKMIGAHVPPKPAKKNSNSARDKARDFNEAFDRVFAAKEGRTHLAFTPAQFHGHKIK